MRVEIKDKNLGIAKDELQVVLQLVRFALGRFANRIGRATILLEKDRTPELRCRITLTVSRETIVIEAAGRDLDSTTARVATRAFDSVARFLARERAASWIGQGR